MSSDLHLKILYLFSRYIDLIKNLYIKRFLDGYSVAYKSFVFIVLLLTFYKRWQIKILIEYFRKNAILYS